MPLIESQALTPGTRFALVVSSYHEFVTDRLREGAVRALEDAGVPAEAMTVVRVPGAFEIPATARRLAATGRFGAVICLGCVIRGETPHFEYISAAVANGLVDAASSTGVPVTFGVLTTNSAEEAIARAGDGPSNKGREAAGAALAMASVFAQLGGLA